MDEQEFPSDSEQSDEDYRPDQQQESEVSEVDSDGNLDETEPNSAKKISVKKRKKAKTYVPDTKTQIDNKPENIGAATVTDADEDDKERSDALWADFLSGTDPLPTKKSETKKESNENTPVKDYAETKRKPEPQKKVITEIFEFAGEKVEVTKELNEPATIGSEKSVNNSGGSSNSIGRRVPFSGIKRTSGGGIGSVLGQIAKKNKISVLDKSKLDWDSFKRNAGIDEELQTFNKGKDGYLERQDFLERTDVRQFELEKSIRLSKRNNRNC